MIINENNWAPNGFFEDQFQKDWEDSIFKILDYYKKSDKIYIDNIHLVQSEIVFDDC